MRQHGFEQLALLDQLIKQFGIVAPAQLDQYRPVRRRSLSPRDDTPFGKAPDVPVAPAQLDQYSPVRRRSRVSPNKTRALIASP